MADNIEITQGSGTTVATEDVSGVQHQKVKIEFGTDGVATMVSDSDPLPVSATIDTTGLATDATDTNTATIASDTTSIDGKIPALGQALAAASVPVVLTAAQLTTLTPPAAISGFATSAKQDTLIAKDYATQTTLAAINTKLASGTVIGDVNLGATDNAVLDDIAAKLATIDADTSTLAAGVSTEYQVDVVGALPAGTNALGKLLPPDVDITAHTNYAKKYYTNAGAVTDGIIWSPAAGKRWHILSLTINVSAAATVTLEDDKAGGDEAVMKFEFAANSGITIPFPEKYPFASGEDAADLIITTTAGNVYVTAVGYEI